MVMMMIMMKMVVVMLEETNVRHISSWERKFVWRLSCSDFEWQVVTMTKVAQIDTQSSRATYWHNIYIKSTYLQKQNLLKLKQNLQQIWHKIYSQWLWSTNWWSWCNSRECKGLSQTCLTRHDMQQLGKDDKRWCKEKMQFAKIKNSRVMSKCAKSYIMYPVALCHVCHSVNLKHKDFRQRNSTFFFFSLESWINSFPPRIGNFGILVVFDVEWN